MTTTRRQFNGRLDRLVNELDAMVTQVGAAMRTATKALFEADAGLAAEVLAGDAEVVAAQVGLDEAAIDLLMREQTVATDLRTIVACLRMSADVRRMGKLAVHVAEIASARHPDTAVPGALWPTVRKLSERALALMADAARAVAVRDDAALAVLERDDDKVDQLYEVLHGELLTATRGLGADAAVEIAMVARYYERYADHAVELGRGIAYMTGRAGLDGRLL